MHEYKPKSRVSVWIDDFAPKMVLLVLLGTIGLWFRIEQHMASLDIHQTKAEKAIDRADQIQIEVARQIKTSVEYPLTPTLRDLLIALPVQMDAIEALVEKNGEDIRENRRLVLNNKSLWFGIHPMNVKSSEGNHVEKENESGDRERIPQSLDDDRSGVPRHSKR